MRHLQTYEIMNELRDRLIDTYSYHDQVQQIYKINQQTKHSMA
jgi:hypothetical protein